MLGTYIYFDEVRSRLHLFRRDEKFLPVGTITDCMDGLVVINLWAPLILSSLEAHHKKSVEIETSIVYLSRENGVGIKRKTV